MSRRHIKLLYEFASHRISRRPAPSVDKKMPEVNKTTVLKKVLRKSISVDSNLLGKAKKPTGQPRKPLKSTGDEEQKTKKKTTKTRSESVKGT